MPDSRPQPPRFTDTPVTDAAAHALLTAYFTERALSFPAQQGRYRPSFPAAEQFVPPVGVFLLLGEPAAEGFVGCGGIRRLDGAPAGTVRYEIKHLWLHPSTRGRGWGRSLLAELERRARGFGATEVVLDTNASLLAAGALYASAGYAEIEAYNTNPNATTWYSKPLLSESAAP
ncbi:GNAT family N-acetyltransferase [Cryobacterium frigoriphilum]|uniref:GNAT family N-acetyltransferase n=1 Tax=Cryobacterium frigoriphilum TaxID=1259150 RepID=A0A4R8ZY53_9MICO|nr:GNAT family N-acetyltransferase [Cryobacterium frigoriphilum]TFD48771.1 GNAT family N-acetyltransferase [Cryobacterium frigoriphilum]